MSVDLPHLHRVLRDETRAKLLELLEKRGSLGYVEMLGLLEISHTGKLNYHLKILGDLLSKDNESGKYSLSEKGKLAVALLGKFQTLASSKQMERKARLKEEYTVAGVNLAILPVIFHLIAPSTFTFAITFASYIIGYTLMAVNYFWYTGMDSENPNTARIIGRFFAMVVFGDLLMGANFALVEGVKVALPFVNAFPSYFFVILGLLPGFVIGAKVGDIIGKRYGYKPFWWPLK